MVSGQTELTSISSATAASANLCQCQWDQGGRDECEEDGPGVTRMTSLLRSHLESQALIVLKMSDTNTYTYVWFYFFLFVMSTFNSAAECLSSFLPTLILNTDRLNTNTNYQCQFTKLRYPVFSKMALLEGCSLYYFYISHLKTKTRSLKSVFELPERLPLRSRVT